MALMFILFALVAVPVTSPVRGPEKLEAVTIPETLSWLRVPTDVREELTTPLPRVFAERTPIPLILYFLLAARLIFSVESQASLL